MWPIRICLKLALDEVVEAFLGRIKGPWDLVGADILNEAKETALDVFVVISKKFINIFVKVLFHCNNHPLRIHLKQK